MDVDLVITELEVGGAERCLASLACFLRRQNHRVRVVSLGPKPSSEKSQLVDAMARSAWSSTSSMAPFGGSCRKFIGVFIA